jgi:hypothetical protein
VILVGNGKQVILHTFESGTATLESVEIPLHFKGAPVVGSDNIVRGIRIFRAGSFKDSQGRPTKWSPEQLRLMVDNFNALVSSGIFPHVPVKTNHSRDVKDIVGYFEKLYVDEGGFLAADVKFTEPDGLTKWNNGTFRNRSIELGAYETNDGEKFYPAVMGLAFVDTGAVEGLFAKDDEVPLHAVFSLVDGNKEMEPQMTELDRWLAANPGKTAQDWHNAVVYAHAKSQEDAWVAAANYAKWEQDASYAQAVQDHFAQAEQLGVQTGGAPPQPAPQFALHIGGQMISDPAAAQHAIHGLEQFRSETIMGGRTEFIQNLVKANKLPKTQEQDEIQFALGLSDAQWDHYRKTREAVATPSLFQSYGDGGEGGAGAGAGSNPAGIMGFQQPGGPAMDAATASEIVDNHKRAGKSAEFIKSTASFKFLEAAGQAPQV